MLKRDILKIIIGLFLWIAIPFIIIFIRIELYGWDKVFPYQTEEEYEKEQEEHWLMRPM
jgi:hypothetical protein